MNAIAKAQQMIARDIGVIPVQTIWEAEIADAIRAAVEQTRREMMLPCAACAERGELVTRRMNTEPGECPHGYAFDCCTQCHEAFQAGRAEENKRWAKRVREWAWDPQAPEAYRSAWKHILFELEQKDGAEETPTPPERGAP
jgi:hypothetical protein